MNWELWLMFIGGVAVGMTLQWLLFGRGNDAPV